MRIFNQRLNVIFVCFVVLSLGGMARAAISQSEFVLLIYMNGSNLESESKLATHNIRDMLWAGTSEVSDDNLTILLLMGGTRRWHLDEDMPGQSLSSDSITYARITRDGFRKIRSLSNRSIGNSSTLTEFMDYGMQEFPAKRYGLIFWNHGAGSVTGFGYDELHPDDTSLSLGEIHEGLQQSHFSGSAKLAFIGFDACLMATLETAEAVSPYADYLVASQELEPGKGWDYKSITESLRRNPQMPGDQIGRLIADSFVDSYKEKEYEQVTLSVTDLNRVGALTASIGKFSEELNRKMGYESDTAGLPFYKKLSGFRSDSKSFGMPAFTCHGPDMVDILDFCQHIRSEVGIELVNEISRNTEEAVVYTRKSDNLAKEHVCGLSVYFPCYNLNVAKELSEYNRCGFNQEYLELVGTFARKLFEGSRSRKITDIVRSDSTLLSTEMLLNVRKIYSIVLAYEDRQWVTYGLDGDGVSLDQDGRIVKKDYAGEMMKEWDRKWISIGGKTVSAYMALSNKNTLTYTVPVYLNNEPADLILRYDNTNPSGKVYGARKITGNNIPDKGMTGIKANDTIILLHERFDENGAVKYVSSNDTIIVKKKKDLKVRIDTVPKGVYRYGYCLVDLYGRKYYIHFYNYKVE